MELESRLIHLGAVFVDVLSASERIRWLRRTSLLVKIAALIFLCMTALALGVMTLARAGTLPTIHNVDQSYHPGHSLPLLAKDSECTPSDYLWVSCRIHVSGQEVYLSYEVGTRKIVGTALHVEYKIGDLIVAWGFPTGLTKNGDLILVYWGTRSAILYTSSFQPHSRVKFIKYNFDPVPTDAWHGFRD